MSDEARRQLFWMSLEDRCADVCPGCGLHMLLDLDARLKWLREGGEARCVGCGLTKTREVVRENATGGTYEGPVESGIDSEVRQQVDDAWLAAFNAAMK